jgi:hypothetical protein
VEVLPLVLDFELAREEDLLSVLPDKRCQVLEGISLARIRRALLLRSLGPENRRAQRTQAAPSLFALRVARQSTRALVVEGILSLT